MRHSFRIVLSLLAVLALLTTTAPPAAAEDASTASSWQAAGPSVFGLGDSLFLQCGPTLGVGSRSVGMIGWAGGTTEGMRRRLSSGVGGWPYMTESSHAEELASFRHASTLVVGLGTNDVRGLVSAARYRANVDWFMERAAGRPVLWFNLVNPEFQSTADTYNGILVRAATRYPNLRILDWAGYVRDHPDAVMDDGVHLSSFTACREGRLALVQAAVPPVEGVATPDPAWTDPPPQDPPTPDPVTQEYAATGGPGGPLGPPIGPVSCHRKQDGCLQFYAHGGLTWTPGTGVQRLSETVARSWSHYAELGRVGYPVAAETCDLPDGGCRQRFEAGWMFSSPSTGARDVIDGPMLDKYLALGGAGGDLGYPLGIPACGAPRDGCVQRFQGGSIYWTGSTGARVVSGAVRSRWAAAGGPSGSMGFPTTDTICGLRKGGCGQNFTGGSVYWSPATGARVVTGVIRARWVRSGGVYSRYGYPIAAQRTISGGWSQRFSGGTLTYRHGRWT